MAIASLAGLASAGPAWGLQHQPQRPVCPGPASLGSARCVAHVITNERGRPLATKSPTGYGPTQFHSAYGLPTTGTKAQTIAIVDAYDDPTIASDLNAYNSYYGITACGTGCFTKVNQNGNAGPYPRANAGWALEIALDVETAHQTCQSCKILLVEANSNSFSDLETAVRTAARLGATEISNSYGGSEFSSEASDTAYNQPRIAVTVSSGDNGYGTEFPASSPYVVAVGGTTLNLNRDGSYASESVWSGAGSGCSAYVNAQSWQTSLSNWSLTGCGSRRAVADVAADANPNTGASVYDTTKYQGRSGWFQVGGTSLSAPLIAGVYGLAGNAASVTYPASIPYGSQSNLHDVTQGSNGSCGTIMCAAASGYDGPTGVGTPNTAAGF
jgi:subtilase family serine protease